VETPCSEVGWSLFPKWPPRISAPDTESTPQFHPAGPILGPRRRSKKHMLVAPTSNSHYCYTHYCTVLFCLPELKHSVPTGKSPWLLCLEVKRRRDSRHGSLCQHRSPPTCQRLGRHLQWIRVYIRTSKRHVGCHI